MNLSSLAAAFFAVIGVTIHLPSHSAAPVNEIGFHGKVISPEIPLEELWVRLHILNLTPLEDEASDPEDFSTWLFAAGNQRSKPIRVEADGSYQLVGNAPRDQYGRLRRYAIEVSIDPPGRSWPKIDSQGLLPVALHWIGPAIPQRLHKVPDLTTSKPYRISVQAEEVSGFPLPLSRRATELRIARIRKTEDHSWMEKRTWSILLAAGRKKNAFELTNSLPNVVYFTSVGPTWLAEIRIIPNGPRYPISPRSAPASIVLDHDQVIPIELPSMTWVIAHIAASDRTPSVNDLISLRLHPVNAVQAAEAAEQMPLSIPGDNEKEERILPVLGNEFREYIPFTPPSDANPLDVLETDTHFGYAHEGSVWLPMGWSESGNHVLEAVNAANGEVWRSQPLQLEPNAILPIPLVPVHNPLVALRLNRNVTPGMVRGIQAFGPQGQRLELNYSWLPIRSTARSLKELPAVRLPIGTSQVVLVSGHGEYQSDDTLLLTAPIPADGVPAKGLRLSWEDSEYVLPKQSASGWIDELVIRAKGEQPASGSTGFPVIRLRGFATPHSIYGLPPGDYLGELRFREEIDHHFDILGQPTKFSTKTIEFSVK